MYYYFIMLIVVNFLFDSNVKKSELNVETLGN